MHSRRAEGGPDASNVPRRALARASDGTDIGRARCNRIFPRQRAHPSRRVGRARLASTASLILIPSGSCSSRDLGLHQHGPPAPPGAQKISGCDAEPRRHWKTTTFVLAGLRLRGWVAPIGPCYGVCKSSRAAFGKLPISCASNNVSSSLLVVNAKPLQLGCSARAMSRSRKSSSRILGRAISAE